MSRETYLSSLVAAVVKNAKHRSESGAQELSQLVDMVQPKRLANNPQVLRVFLGHLRAAPPTTHIDSDHYLDEKLAALSLSGVRQVFTELRPMMEPIWPYPPSTFPITDLIRAWPDIWRWMKHLKTTIDSHPDIFDSPPQFPTITVNCLLDGISYIIAKLWFFQCSDTPAKFTVTRTPGVLALLEDVLIHQGNRDDVAPLLTDSALIPIASMLESNALGIDDLINAPVAKLRRLSSTLLSILRALASADYKDRHGWEDILLRVIETMTSKSPRLNEILLSQNLLVVYCHMLTSLTIAFYHNSTNSVHDEASSAAINDVHSSVVRIFDYVGVTTMREDDGVFWMSQAIQTGLFKSILMYSGGKFNEVEYHALPVLQSLIRYTAYHAILKASHQAMKDPTIKVFEEHIPRTRKKIRKEWETFKDLLEDRLRTKAVFEEDKNRYNKCQSKNCNGWDSSRLKFCGACHYVFYCSNECQKDDWPYHRGICKRPTVVLGPEIRKLTMSKRERVFLKFLGIREFEIYLQTIVARSGKSLDLLSNKITEDIGRVTVWISLFSVPARFGISICRVPPGFSEGKKPHAVLLVEAPMGTKKYPICGLRIDAAMVKHLGILCGEDVDLPKLGAQLYRIPDEQDTSEIWC